MGEFDDAYRMGLVDSTGVATGLGWEDERDQEEYYREESDSSFRYLDVFLTPSSLLKSNERYARANLYKEYDTEIYLELIHDRGNEYDRKALEVYYNRTFIGHIRKRFDKEDIDNTKTVNDFCFDGNRLSDVELLWNGEAFRLRQKTHQAIEKELAKQEKANDKLIENENMKMKKISDLKSTLIRARQGDNGFTSAELTNQLVYDTLKNRFGASSFLGKLVETVTGPSPIIPEEPPHLARQRERISELEYNITCLERQPYGTYNTRELKSVTPAGPGLVSSTKELVVTSPRPARKPRAKKPAAK